MLSNIIKNFEDTAPQSMQLKKELYFCGKLS